MTKSPDEESERASGATFGPLATADNTTIFVHSSYRTGSTWLWGKLRKLPKTIAYCEIFHEQLATIDSKTAIEIDHSTWHSKHPPLAPYFLEFLPFFKGSNGIMTYKPEMAYERFIPSNGIRGDLSEEEEIYLSTLIDYAKNNGRIPVLTDVRTLGRVHAMRKAFPSKAIFLYRNIFHQWASYTGQSVIHNNNYFLERTNEIIKLSRHDEIIRHIDDWFQSREVSVYNEKMFCAFMLLHIYLYAIAVEVTDLDIDVTKIYLDRDSRHDVEKRLENLLCAPVDLSDVKADFELSLVNVPSQPRFVDTIEQFIKFIIDKLHTKRQVAFVKNITADALYEWRNYNFYTSVTKSYFVSTLDIREKAFNVEREDLAAKLSETVPSRDRLDAHISTLEGTLALMREEKHATTIRLDQLVSELQIVRQMSADDATRRGDLLGQLQIREQALLDATAREVALAERAAERDDLLAQLQNREKSLLDANEKLGVELSDAKAAALATQQKVTTFEETLALLREEKHEVTIRLDQLVSELQVARQVSADHAIATEAAHANALAITRNQLETRLLNFRSKLVDAEAALGKVTRQIRIGETAWNRMFLPRGSVSGAERALIRGGLLDLDWYRKEYPEVTANGQSPARHYLEDGYLRGYRPNPYFDTRWYLDRYEDVRRSGLNPLLHYALHGYREGRDPGPNFETNYYLLTYPDVRASGMNPLVHFLLHGRAEGRFATHS
jgi:hypothetical protein